MLPSYAITNIGGSGRVSHVVGHVWSKMGRFGAKAGVGHWIGQMDDESGVCHVVFTKRQLFSETNKNTNYLSTVWYVPVMCIGTSCSLLARRPAPKYN